MASFDGEKWEKVDTAIAATHALMPLGDASRLADGLLRLLGPPMKHQDPTRDLFIAGEKYGTRSSTAIVVEGTRILFVEQNYGRRGVPIGERRMFTSAASP